MLVDFSILTLITALYVYYTFLVKKDFKRISFLYSFTLITIFYTPSLYFFFGGTAYKFFTDASLIEFMHFGSFSIFIYLMLSIWIDSLKISPKQLYIKNTWFIRVYFLLFGVAIFLYYAIYFKHFPLVHFFLSGELIDRPDLTGNIPHFFTISSIVSIIIPSIYFFYFHKIHKKYQHFIINAILFFLFLASGNKGFITYYLIFIWLYIFEAKIDAKLLIILFFLALIYMVSKGIMTLNNETLSYMMNSPFRRFFVTQGTGFIHRIDMINNGFDFVNNVSNRGIKFDVFKYMYNTIIVGSAPTFYTGDILVKYGKNLAYISFFIISGIVLYVSKYLYIIKTNIKLFFYWNIYALLFMMVMSGVHFTNSLRIFIAIMNIFIIVLLSRLVYIKYSRRGSND